MVGLINTVNFDFESDLERLLKIHFKIGRRDKIGHPLDDSSFSASSDPPNKIISPFLMRISDSKLRSTVFGGAYFEIFSVKSDCFTATCMVMFSFPDTIGKMVTLKSAFTDL